MTRLLVNAPSGKQEIIIIDVSGAYFDSAQVLWDERTDGPLPSVTLGKMQRTGNQLTELANCLSAHIDSAKESKKRELMVAYEAAITAPVVHNTITWTADKEAQSLLVSCLSSGSVPPGMYWRDVNKTPHAITYADLQALAGAMITRGLIADTNLQAKLANVDAAQTMQDIDQIVW